MLNRNFESIFRSMLLPCLNFSNFELGRTDIFLKGSQIQQLAPTIRRVPMQRVCTVLDTNISRRSKNSLKDASAMVVFSRIFSGAVSAMGVFSEIFSGAVVGFFPRHGATSVWE